MKNKKRRLVERAAIAAVTAALLTGCSGASQTGSEAGSSGETAEAAAGTTAAAQEETSAAAITSGKGESGAAGITGTESALLASTGSDLGSSLRLASRPTGDLARLNPEKELDTMSSEEQQDMDRAIRAFTPAKESLLINDAETYYYYDELDEETQDLYDAMLLVASNPEADVNEYAVPVTVNSDPSGDEFMQKYWDAYFAMVYDHPEMFWLYNQSETLIDGSYLEYGDGTWDVYLYLVEPYENYTEEMTAFNEAAEDFLNEIDTTQSEMDIARQVHDKLVNLVTYDNDLLEETDDTAGMQNLGHTAYGCFVEDSYGNENHAVCDGYALAYEYLLQQLGIEAVFIPGYAGEDESDVGGHAWSMANLDGKWYEIDCTWDDDDGAYAQYAEDETIDSRIREALNNAEYMDLLNHEFYAITTSRMRNFAPETNDYFTTVNGTTFTLFQECVHIRDNEYMTEGPTYDLAELAPVAE